MYYFRFLRTGLLSKSPMFRMMAKDNTCVLLHILHILCIVTHTYYLGVLKVILPTLLWISFWVGKVWRVQHQVFFQWGTLFHPEVVRSSVFVVRYLITKLQWDRVETRSLHAVSTLESPKWSVQSIVRLYSNE